MSLGDLLAMFEVIFSRGVDGRESADGRENVSGRVEDVVPGEISIGYFTNLIRRVGICSSVYTLIRIVVHLLKQFDGLCPVDLVMFFVG